MKFTKWEKGKTLKKKKKPLWSKLIFWKDSHNSSLQIWSRRKARKIPNYQLWNCKRDKISKCCSDILKDCKIISILVMDKIDFLGSNLWS